MPNLSRHGIGSGKYRVGGTYGENILRVDTTLSRQRLKEIDLSDGGTDNNFKAFNITRDVDGNLYVSGDNTNGVAQIKKYDKNGGIVWKKHIPHPTQPDSSSNEVRSMCHGLGTDLLYVWSYYDKHIVALDITSGDERFRHVPSVGTSANNAPILKANKDYLAVGYSVSSSTNPTFTIYEHSSAQQRQETILNMRSFHLKDDNKIIIANASELYQMNMVGVRDWTYSTLQALDTSYTWTSYIQCDSNDNIWLMSAGWYSTSNSGQSFLYVINGNDGTLIRKHLRNSDSSGTGYPDNINTSTSGTEWFNDDRTMLLPQNNYGYFVGNNSDYPISAFRTYSPANIYIRSFNEQGDTYGTMVIKGTEGSMQYGASYSGVFMDEDKILYLAVSTGAIGTRKIYIIDPKTYYKIQY